MVYHHPSIKNVFNGFDPNNENHIYITVVFRKILHDVTQLRPYHNHMPTLISFVNAITSKNINMIEEETKRFEDIYFHDGLVFPVHPLQMIHSILNKGGDPVIDDLRKFLSQLYENTTGDNTSAVNMIESWLLTVNLKKFQSITNLVYDT